MARYGRHRRPRGGLEGQTEGRQLDNLRDLSAALGNEDEQFFSVRNGYTFATGPRGLQNLGVNMAAMDVAAVAAAGAQLRVGVQADTVVRRIYM